MYILYIYIILIIIKGFLAAVALPPIFNINKKYEQEIKESKQLHQNKKDTTTTSRCRRKKISSDHGVTIEPMPIYSLHNPFMFYKCLTRKYISLSLTCRSFASQLIFTRNGLEKISLNNSLVKYQCSVPIANTTIC